MPFASLSFILHFFFCIFITYIRFDGLFYVCVCVSDVHESVCVWYYSLYYIYTYRTHIVRSLARIYSVNVKSIVLFGASCHQQHYEYFLFHQLVPPILYRLSSLAHGRHWRTHSTRLSSTAVPPYHTTHMLHMSTALVRHAICFCDDVNDVFHTYYFGHH